MYAAQLLFSRLLLVATIALPAFCFLTAGFHSGVWQRAQVVPPCHHQQQVNEAPAQLVVEEAAFGVSRWLDGEGYVFSETDHIHLAPGTTFGWRLKLQSPLSNDPMRAVLMREEFVLPSAPSNWGLGPNTQVSGDKKMAVTERVMSPTDGWLSREWSITEGDPEGAYEMRVFLDDKLVQTFQFEAHAPH